MKRGLVIGKFMPLHLGHIALIRFAAAQCDELIVSLSYTLHDPIDFNLRFFWIRQVLSDQPHIKPEILLDDFDNESLSLSHRAKIWAAIIKMRFPSIDLLFSSEEYGESFAARLGVPSIVFDMQRGYVPVSASVIRENPFRYWDFIPEIVRPYFVKKVCFYGPESTGKSVLAMHMAEVYQTEYVPEVAREMITSNNFSVGDIVRIGHAQTQRILEKTKTANKILFCDTDLITTQIYSQHYLHQVPEVLQELEHQVKYDKYFLFDIDFPWVADGLRDLGNQREKMYALFKRELVKREIPYIEVQGNVEHREQIVRREVDQLIQ